MAKLRQTDALPPSARCYNKTYYPLQRNDAISKYTFPTCIYLKDGKCQLNACVKNMKGEQNDEVGYFKERT